jgi:hypothetical protein
MTNLGFWVVIVSTAPPTPPDLPLHYPTPCMPLSLSLSFSPFSLQITGRSDPDHVDSGQAVLVNGRHTTVDRSVSPSHTLYWVISWVTCGCSGWCRATNPPYICSGVGMKDAYQGRNAPRPSSIFFHFSSFLFFF